MWRKRILSGLLACLMVLSSIPATALAEEPLLLEETSSFTAETIEETLPEETETTEETLPEETEDTEPTEQTLPEVTEGTEPTEETLPEVTEDTEATEETLPEAEEELLLVEAEPVDAAPEAEGDVVFVEIPFQVNPLYEGLVDPADYEDWEPELVAPSTYGLRTEYLTEAEAAVSIREYMCARENVFTVSFTTTKEYTDTDYALLVGQAMTHTGKPTEGDYLRWQYGGYSISGSYRPLSDGTYQYSITITIPYYSSAAQEAEVDAAVDALLTQLDLDGLSDYGKIKAVYDYICKTVTYDFGNLNNKEYTLKYTAYAALLNEHTAVCQGYAVLLYRLALELGIDCRFISGNANGRHGWNIIKLGSKYYNADSTWDATELKNYGRYAYFLKGSGFDSSHTRDAEYKTSAFKSAYPTSTSNYSITDSGPCGENLNWVLDGSGTLTISGSGEMTDFYFSEAGTLNTPWYSSRNSITSVVIQPGVTSLGINCFYGCKNLTSVSIPDTVTTLNWGCFMACSRLASIVLPDSVTSVAGNCFKGCTSLTSVNIPGSVTFIGDSCFKDCASLTAVNIPDSVTSIGEYCFSGCGNLQMFDLSGIPGNMEFRDTLSLDGLVTVPPAFQSCEWTLQTLSGEPDTDNIARITKGDDGAHQLEIIGSGRFQLVLLDETSKAQGSTTIEATGSTEILAARDYLFSGGKLQLSVVDLADNSKPKVQWSVVEGAGFASISSGGVLTAKTVSEEQVVTVSSTVVSRGDRAYMRFRILPKSEGIFLKMGEETLNESRDLDMSQISSVSLSAFTPRVEEALAVTWASSNTKVATVDKTTGVVTLKYPGTAKITATAADGSGVKSGVTLNVSYLDTAKTLKAVLEELPPIGLQPGQSAKMVVSGTSSIDADNLIFKSSNPAIAAVAEDGTITATGEKTGSVTITASLKGDDPLDRKVSAKITVISMQADTLALTVPEGMETEDGTLVFDKSDADQSFTLSAETTDWHHAPFAADITWSSSDTSVAKVDGAGKVTIPANANGECVITATSNDLAKASDQISVSVRDYSPRLAETVLSMNTALKQGVTVGLVESYGRGIDSVRVLEETSLFEAVYEDNLLTIKPKETAGTIKKGTYSLTLAVEDEDGKIYDDYRITLKASESLPSVSVKQAEKINLFYTDSTANLSISAPGKTIEGVELTLTDDFYVTYSEGAATLHYAKSPQTTKLDTKATLEIWLDGYRVPVTKTITISTTTSAPKLRLSSTASTINTALGDKSVRIQVLDSSGEALDNADISASASFATPSVDGNTLTLTLNGTSGGTASIYVTRDNWSQSVKLTHKVSVSTKLPTVKLASTALKLDRYFTYKTAQTTVSLSQSNLALENVTVEPAARESSSTAKKIGWTYDKDAQCLTASFNNTDDIKAGTYSFTYRGTLSDGTSVTGGTLKITVGGSLPKVKLSATTVKLNSSLDEKESVLIRPTISGGTGYTLVGMKVTESTDWLRFTDDTLQVKLTGTPSSKKYTFHVSPVFQIDGTGTRVTLTAQALTVQVYSGTPKVSSLSAKGKLDTLNPASAITYTPKLANCLGTVTAVHLDEAYSTQFDATVVNGRIQLTLKEGVQYATNVTYKVRFRLTVCGKELLSHVVSVKVTQSSVKLTASPTSLTLFQSQTAPLTGKLTMSAGQVGAISVNSRSSSELKAAIKRLAYDNTTQKLTLFFGNKGLLKAGKSYTLYLDVTPVNNAQNLKPTQIKLTVKVSK